MRILGRVGENHFGELPRETVEQEASRLDAGRRILCDETERTPGEPGAAGPRRAGAFTLLELLAVIAIIAILAALLFPTLGRAKQKAQGVICLGHLKQLQVGWIMYANDHQDHLAPNRGGDTAGKSAGRPCWVAGEMRLDSQGGDKTDSTNTCMLVGEAYSQFGSIGTYVKNVALYRCPADKSTVTIGQAVLPRVRSISMNGYMGGAPGENLPDKPFREFRKFADLTDPGPSQTWVFIDEREDSINDGFFVVDAAARYAIIDYPASYHNGAGGLAFADGHAEYHKWLEPTTTPVLQPGQPLEGGSKPTSPDDRDMAWLVPRTTSRR